MKSSRYRISMAIACLAVTAAAHGGALNTLRDAARQTVLNNPEVLSAFHEFQAAEQQTRVAKGGYLPRVDLEAAVGAERIDEPRFDEYDFTRDRVSLMLNQMIYDGFATRNRVRSFDFAARRRYFEVLDASERLSAEVARAYYDVLRHRELVELSKDNYAAHRLIYEQIERRTRAGVSRGVDLEQAFGRLALSESNLLTDVTNLHDASMRYQRIVGETPAESLQEPELAPNLLPGTVNDTLALAYASNPQMNAMIANVWSANSAADVQKATMLPRFDVRARQDIWNDKDDINGRHEEGVIELAMTYNLYNGGSDLAERRRLRYKANQAEDMRTQTCRNVRQEVSIAFNEMRATDEQLVFLDRHQTSIEKARMAYRRQFDIGQRTLLDMLDTENEYYMSRRAYVNARRLNAISYTRALAGTGALVSALELGNDLHPMERPGTDEEAPDMAAVCPPEPDVAPLIDKDAIYREAIRKQGELQHLVAPEAPAATPADVSVEAMRAGTVTRGTGTGAPAAAAPEQPAKASDGW